VLLRRITQHLREQNWIAVGLDLLVVIVGIFLGLQVQELYQMRGDRDSEQAYLNRLHTEVVQNLGFNEENFEALLLLENFQENERDLGEILAVFGGEGAVAQLTPKHCLAIMTSAIYNDQQTYLPTLSELIASGQMSIIESDEIKSSASEYTLAFRALDQQVDQFLNSRVQMFEKYPQFIAIDRRMRDVSKADEIEHQCDFEAMIEHNAFNIDLTNAASKRHYFNLILANQQKSLVRFHAVLDAELGISHQDGSS